MYNLLKRLDCCGFFGFGGKNNKIIPIDSAANVSNINSNMKKIEGLIYITRNNMVNVNPYKLNYAQISSLYTQPKIKIINKLRHIHQNNDFLKKLFDIIIEIFKFFRTYEKLKTDKTTKKLKKTITFLLIERQVFCFFNSIFKKDFLKIQTQYFRTFLFTMIFVIEQEKKHTSLKKEYQIRYKQYLREQRLILESLEAIIITIESAFQLPKPVVKSSHEIFNDIKTKLDEVELPNYIDPAAKIYFLDRLRKLITINHRDKQGEITRSRSNSM